MTKSGPLSKIFYEGTATVGAHVGDLFLHDTNAHILTTLTSSKRC